MENKTLYSTDITDLAAYLIASGATIPELDRQNEKRVVYVFNLSEDHIAAIPHYHDGTGMVSGLAMSGAKKLLMGLIKNPPEQHNV